MLYLQPLRDNPTLKIYRGVEQLVAHRAHNPKVVRSSRAPATTEKLQSNLRLFYLNQINFETALRYVILHPK